MRSFLPGASGRHQGRRPVLLEGLGGQTILHTRVAARGTWTVTARGVVLHSRIQRVEGPGAGAAAASAVGLRDPRLVGAVIQGAELLPDAQLRLTVQGAGGPLHLSTVPHWRLEGPRGALLRADERGELSEHPPGPPVHAAPERLAEHAASRRSGIEDRLLATGRDGWLHPGHVVAVLASAGALEDEEFERRGPVLLARMLARGEIRAGFVTAGRFRAWDMPLAEVVEHIGTTWTALGGRTPGPDMIAWFELTRSGRAALGPRSELTMPPGMSGYDSPGVVGGFR